MKSKKSTIKIGSMTFTVSNENEFKGKALNTKSGSMSFPQRRCLLYSIKGAEKAVLDKLSSAQASGIIDILKQNPVKKVYTQKYVERCRKVVAASQGF